MTAALGLSAPDTQYPASTQVRAFAVHLIFGAAVASVVEGGWRLLERDWRGR